MFKRLWSTIRAADPGHGHAMVSPPIAGIYGAEPSNGLRNIAHQVFSVYQLGNGYLLASEYQQTVFCADVEALTDTIKGIELRRALESQAKQYAGPLTSGPQPAFPTPVYSGKQQP